MSDSVPTDWTGGAGAYGGRDDRPELGDARSAAPDVSADGWDAGLGLVQFSFWGKLFAGPGNRYG